MKRIIVIGEGQTEQEFCTEVLKPFFITKNISIENPTIKESNGGIVKWKVLKKQIETHLKQDTEAFVTLLIDYYGMYSKYGFPRWEESKRIVNKAQRMTFIENAMLEDIDDSYRYRFIPYIQLHEFEGLLFCNKEIIDNSFDKDEFKDYAYLEETFERYPNPEDINDSPETAPSKRLIRSISGYNKTVYGSLLAHDIGLKTILEKCPRFNEWIEKLLNV